MKRTTLGVALIGSLNEALEHARGKRVLRSTEINLPPPPPKWTAKKISMLRIHDLRVSQSAFAAIANVSSATVQAWEQGLKTPSGAASRLLQILKSNPKSFILAADPR